MCISPEIHGTDILYYKKHAFCGTLNWDSTEQYRNYNMIPLFLMLVMYSLIWVTLRKPPPSMADQGNRRISQRRRLANMLFLVVVGFFVCWSPYSILESILIFSYPVRQSNAFFVWMTFSFLFVFASSAINPIVYGFMSEEMRKNAISTFYRQRHVQVAPEGQE